MTTDNQIREDLKDIRYYYSLQKVFEQGAKYVRPVAVLQMVDRYNNSMQNAPAQLYALYVSLYIQNNSQTALAEEWGYARPYIRDLNDKLVSYLQNNLK